MLNDLVLKNRSYRRFYQGVTIELETLRELVNLARLSASGANRQALKYILANDPRRNSLIFNNITLAGAEGVDSFISKPFPLTVFERKILEAWNHRYNPSPLEHMLQVAGKAIQEKDFPNALRRVEEVLASFSDSARAWTLKGISESGLGQLHEAEESLKQAVDLNPSYVKAQETLSNLYLEKGDMKSARQLTEKVVAICPLRMKNHMKLAHLYVALGDANSAETVSKNIARLFSDSGDMRAEIGDALLKKNFNDVAERVLNGSIQEQKKSGRTSPEQLVHIYNRRGIALRKQGKFEEAVLNYLEALQIEPRNPGLHFNLGTAYFKTEKNKQAAESYRAALSLDPDFKEAANALRYLEKHFRETPVKPLRAAGSQPALRRSR